MTTAKEETITPLRASKLLENCQNVRRIRSEHVALLAQAMRDGWQNNGATIKMDRNGRVIDGEHRLRACILANVPFQTLIAYGVDNCSTIDAAMRPRTVVQLMSSRGAKNANVVASIARMALILQETDEFTRVNLTSRGWLGIARLTEYCDKHLDALVKAASLAMQPGAVTGAPSGAFGLVAYMNPDYHKLAPFLEGVASGEGLQRGSPIYALRERLLGVRRRRARVTFADGCACIFKGWNAHVDDERMYQLRWTGIYEGIARPYGELPR
jgi:ParB-like chromosome segregation protein Spo0J